jgi:hypothetical protein
VPGTGGGGGLRRSVASGRTASSGRVVGVDVMQKIVIAICRRSPPGRRGRRADLGVDFVERVAVASLSTKSTRCGPRKQISGSQGNRSRNFDLARTRPACGGTGCASGLTVWVVLTTLSTQPVAQPPAQPGERRIPGGRRRPREPVGATTALRAGAVRTPRAGCGNRRESTRCARIRRMRRRRPRMSGSGGKGRACRRSRVCGGCRTRGRHHRRVRQTHREDQDG